jgi:hypothetical protein
MEGTSGADVLNEQYNIIRMVSILLRGVQYLAIAASSRTQVQPSLRHTAGRDVKAALDSSSLASAGLHTCNKLLVYSFSTRRTEPQSFAVACRIATSTA